MRRYARMRRIRVVGNLPKNCIIRSLSAFSQIRKIFCEHFFQPLRLQHAVGPGLELLTRRLAQALLRPHGQGTEAANEQALQGKGFAFEPTFEPGRNPSTRWRTTLGEEKRCL